MADAPAEAHAAAEAPVEEVRRETRVRRKTFANTARSWLNGGGNRLMHAVLAAFGLDTLFAIIDYLNGDDDGEDVRPVRESRMVRETVVKESRYTRLQSLAMAFIAWFLFLATFAIILGTIGGPPLIAFTFMIALFIIFAVGAWLILKFGGGLSGVYRKIREYLSAENTRDRIQHEALAVMHAKDWFTADDMTPSRKRTLIAEVKQNQRLGDSVVNNVVFDLLRNDDNPVLDSRDPSTWPEHLRPRAEP
jgi:hypothetical protein